jgi:hypothetical protein
MDKACRAYGGDENPYSVLVEKPEGKIPSEDLGVDGRKMLK